MNGGGKNLVMPNVHVINNIFSSQGINESYGAKGVEFSSNLETQMWRSNHLPDFQPPKNARNVGNAFKPTRHERSHISVTGGRTLVQCR